MTSNTGCAFPVFDVFPHRLGVTAQKNPVHVVVIFISLFFVFFVRSIFVFTNMKEEVKGLFALVSPILGEKRHNKSMGRDFAYDENTSKP